MIPIATNGPSDEWGEHDPEAAAAAHDPKREPYASMTRDELLAASAQATTAKEYDMIQEFLYDRMTAKELETMKHAHSLALFLMKEWNASGNDQAYFLCDLAGRVAKEITDGMPPIGSPQDCN